MRPGFFTVPSTVFWMPLRFSRMAAALISISGPKRRAMMMDSMDVSLPIWKNGPRVQPPQARMLRGLTEPEAPSSPTRRRLDDDSTPFVTTTEHTTSRPITGPRDGPFPSDPRRITVRAARDRLLDDP